MITLSLGAMLYPDVACLDEGDPKRYRGNDRHDRDKVAR